MTDSATCPNCGGAENEPYKYRHCGAVCVHPFHKKLVGFLKYLHIPAREYSRPRNPKNRKKLPKGNKP